MIMKKVAVLVTSVLVLTTLAACGQEKTTTSKSADTATKTSKTSKKGQTKASSSSHAKASSKSTTKKVAQTATKPVMSFAQIKTGDFSGLVGDWTEIATGRNHNDSKGIQYENGGSDTLAVSKTSISTGDRGMTLQGNTLTTDTHDYPVRYQEKNNTLAVLLKDPSAVVNWSVTFYPKGATLDYRSDGQTSTATTNTIVVWNSASSYTQVFAQGAQKPQTTQTSQPKINVDQVAAEDYRSLVGEWRDQSGEVIKISDQVLTKPADSNMAFNKGAIVSGGERDGSPEIVVGGEVRNGYVNGGIGNLNAMALDPLAIVPSGTKMTDHDDSDVNRDRLILGAGQGGYASQAYYRD